MNEKGSAIEILHENKDEACKNSECGHIIDSHIHFKLIKEDRVPLMYCSECRAQGKECSLIRF